MRVCWDVCQNTTLLISHLRGDGSPIVNPTSIITDAYNKFVTWKKSVFLVPYGKIGRGIYW